MDYFCGECFQRVLAHRAGLDGDKEAMKHDAKLYKEDFGGWKATVLNQEEVSSSADRRLDEPEEYEDVYELFDKIEIRDVRLLNKQQYIFQMMQSEGGEEDDHEVNWDLANNEHPEEDSDGEAVVRFKDPKIIRTIKGRAKHSGTRTRRSSSPGFVSLPSTMKQPQRSPTKSESCSADGPNISLFWQSF